MKQLLLISILTISIFNGLSKNSSEKHIFYLHGRIIEIQGINAKSQKFGAYKYTEIIDSLKSIGIVHNVVRTNDTDFEEFCKKTSKQIDSLITIGIAAKNITVIGASKGAVMAMYISNINSSPINYIFLAGNNDYRESTRKWNFHGRILGFYEKSDLIAGKDYQYWIDKSTNAIKFEQIELNTGLGHGFLYTPIKEWFNPTKKWIEDEN